MVIKHIKHRRHGATGYQDPQAISSISCNGDSSLVRFRDLTMWQGKNIPNIRIRHLGTPLELEVSIFASKYFDGTDTFDLPHRIRPRQSPWMEQVRALIIPQRNSKMQLRPACSDGPPSVGKKTRRSARVMLQGEAQESCLTLTQV